MKKLTTNWILGLGLALGGVQMANAEKSRSLHESVIEFRQGDEIPISIKASGDLIATKGDPVQYVVVKKNFWIRIQNDNFQISFDGTSYQPLTQEIRGELSIVTDANGGLTIGLQSFLR